MVREGDPFFVVPFNELPDAIDVDYLRKLFYELPVDEIFENEEAMHCLKEIGSDQNFVDYIFNFYDLNGKPNKDIGNVIKLHDLLFEKVYPQPKTKIVTTHPPQIYC